MKVRWVTVTRETNGTYTNWGGADTTKSDSFLHVVMTQILGSLSKEDIISVTETPQTEQVGRQFTIFYKSPDKLTT